MMDSITSFIQNNIPAHAVTGLVGVGAFGNALLTALRARGQRVMLCDPPRSAEDADELCDALHIQWGNGMGGCDFSALSTETFVPLDNLIRYADVICIQVPLTTTGVWRTEHLIMQKHLALCRPGAKIYCFSAAEVIAPDLRDDPRIVIMELA